MFLYDQLAIVRVERGLVELAAPLDEADAEPPADQRDQPVPAVLDQQHLDVALRLDLRADLRRQALEVGEHRRPAELADRADAARPPGEERVLAGRVEHEARAQLLAVRHDPHAVVLHLDLRDRRAEPDLRAAGDRRAREHLVEGRAVDLPRMRRRALQAVGEAEEREVAGALVPELGALLEVIGAAVEPHAEPVEQRQVDRQQRLADVKPGKMLALEHHHVLAGLAQQVGGGRSGGAAADDHDVMHGPPLIPCRR